MQMARLSHVLNSLVSFHSSFPMSPSPRHSRLRSWHLSPQYPRLPLPSSIPSPHYPRSSPVPPSSRLFVFDYILTTRRKITAEKWLPSTVFVHGPHRHIFIAISLLVNNGRVTCGFRQTCRVFSPGIAARKDGGIIQEEWTQRRRTYSAVPHRRSESSRFQQWRVYPRTRDSCKRKEP